MYALNTFVDFDPTTNKKIKLFPIFFSIAGVINRGDSFRRRRSRSNSLAPSSPMSPHHATADTLHSRHGPVDSHRVFMLGGPGVGKNALISQFQTSECINAYEGSG